MTQTQRNDALKIVALVSMLIDHIGYLFFPKELLLRTIGRIAFPIFAYQIAIGFKKTSSRLNYAKRLFIFSLISQVPYMWFNPNLYFDLNSLNIMFTFLISLGVLQLLEIAIQHFKAFKIHRSISWYCQSKFGPINQLKNGPLNLVF